MIKKLAIVTRDMYGGGAERVISQLMKYFDSKGIQCVLITIDKKEIFYEIPKSVKLYEIGKKSNNKIIDRISRYKEVRRIVTENKVDLVLSMPEEIGIYVIPTLIGSKVPLVISERNNPWVMPDRKISRVLRNIFYPFVSGLIFQTEMAASFFSKKIQSKGIVLSNPLDIKRIPMQHVGQRRKEVVAVGRLEAQKNFKLLIEAFSEFYKNNNNYKLVIYGEGNLRDELEKLSKDMLPDGACAFPGKSKNILEKINGASMFVLSSDYEGMPNVLIETMAMGMPVISTNCPSGGPETLIINGNNGLLVPVGDTNALANAMNKLSDESYAKLLGDNALGIKDKLASNTIYEEWLNYLNYIYNNNV